MTDEVVNPPYIDDLTIREVYAETTQTLFGAPGVLRIELCVNRWSQTPPVQRDRMVPVARFALGVETAKVLRDQLTYCLDLAAKQAHLVQTPAASPTKN